MTVILVILLSTLPMSSVFCAPVWACLFILSCLINELSASEHNDIMPSGYGILIKARKTFTTMCTVLASEKKCAECSLLLSVGNHWKGNMEESQTTFSFTISLFLSISFLCTVLHGEDPKTTLAFRLCSTLCWREQAVCCRHSEPCDQRCPLIETLHRKQHIPAFSLLILMACEWGSKLLTLRSNETSNWKHVPPSDQWESTHCTTVVRKPPEWLSRSFALIRTH